MQPSTHHHHCPLTVYLSATPPHHLSTSRDGDSSTPWAPCANDRSSGEEVFPKIQSEPHLVQLEAIPHCPLTVTWQKRHRGCNPHLSTTSFQGVVESDKQNHRMAHVGEDLKDHQGVNQQLRLPRAPSHLALSACRDGAPTALWAAGASYLTHISTLVV